MSVSETVEVAGHLMDSGILGRILDDVREYGGDYLIDKFEVGHDAHDSSRATWSWRPTVAPRSASSRSRCPTSGRG
jgi:hypothetical protein